jgi:mono/diheme cytochrome c family protein
MSLFIKCYRALAVSAFFVLGMTASRAASVEKGKAAFAKFGCWQCHGTVGQGGLAGPKLAPQPLPFEAFSAFVRTTNRQMPPFSEKILSDEDLGNIYAYISSLPPAPDYKTIPALR